MSEAWWLTGIEADCVQGYYDGLDLSSPPPGDNRSDAYKHGFSTGRDDAECQAGIRKWPRHTAQEYREMWAEIERRQVQ